MTLNAWTLFWASAAPGLYNHLWQSTLFAAAVALLAFALRSNHARTRYWLWLAASAKFLLPFSLLIAIGAALPSPHHASAPAQTAYAVVDTISAPFAPAALPAPATRVRHNETHRVPALLACLWLIGAAIVLALWAIEWRRALATVRAAEPLRTGREHELLRAAEALARLPRPIALLSSRQQMEPGVFGLLRPVLLWPAQISPHLCDAQLQCVLAHEVCHVRWRDNLTALIPMLVRAVFWFHPLVWWMERQLVKERELACDQEVLRLCAQPQAYAESILKVCEFCIASPLACVPGITGADLKQRVVHIVAGRIGTQLSTGNRRLLLTAALLTITAPMAFGFYQAAAMPDSVRLFHPAGPMPSYEVATIKRPDPSGYTAGFVAGYASESPDGQGPTIRHYIEEAYGITNRTGARVFGGPAWVATDAYMIQGKIPNDLRLAMQKMTRDQQTEQTRMMQQMLLQQRFHLKLHFETREMPVFDLVPARSGLKIKPVPPPPPGPPAARRAGDPMPPGSFRFSSGSMTFLATTMPAFIRAITSQAELGGRPIVDKTGFTANFDVDNLTWATTHPFTMPGQPPPPPDPAGISLFTALEDKLGMKLVPGKAPVEVIVIDSIDRPTEN